MYKYLKLFPIIIFCLSCDSKITTEKLLVIENLELGKPTSQLNHQLDSLAVPHSEFLTKIAFTSLEELMDVNNRISLYYTKTFDFSDYKTQHVQHLGFLYPEQLEGTKNISGILVLLGHTTDYQLMGDAFGLETNITDKVIRQEVNEEILDKIEKLYISKYGSATKIKMPFGSLYVIENNQIKAYSNDGKRDAEILTWETEYFTITFSKGLKSLDAVYSTQSKLYSETLIQFSVPTEPIKINISKNEIQSYTFPYIEYRLNSKAIKELKLNNKAI
ncbi:MAG: hypothetical protein WKF85_02220 [Chitinophagaceae bacterium]